MRERSLLFNGRMVRAILEDRKTQTRRPVLDRAGEPPPNDACFYKMHWHARAACFDVNGFPRGMHWSARLPCVPGDRFVVRESIATIASGSGLGCDVRYVADGERRTFDPCPDDSPKYRPFFERQTFPSIHMPRWAARLVLPVLRVWVEPLNQLSEQDARSEGFTNRELPNGSTRSAVNDFAANWDAMYRAKNLGWSKNPWVFVIEFYRPSDAADAQKGNLL